jgi:hypothetical protein
MVSCIIDLLPVYVWWYCFTVQYGTCWYLLLLTTMLLLLLLLTGTSTYLLVQQQYPGTCWVWYWYQYLLTGGGTCTGMVLVPTYYQYQPALPSVVCTIQHMVLEPVHSLLSYAYYFWEASMLPNKVCRGRSWYRIV